MLCELMFPVRGVRGVILKPPVPPRVGSMTSISSVLDMTASALSFLLANRCALCSFAVNNWCGIRLSYTCPPRSGIYRRVDVACDKTWNFGAVTWTWNLQILLGDVTSGLFQTRLTSAIKRTAITHGDMYSHRKEVVAMLNSERLSAHETCFTSCLNFCNDIRPIQASISL